jgi:hypothetical protein
MATTLVHHLVRIRVAHHLIGARWPPTRAPSERQEGSFLFSSYLRPPRRLRGSPERAALEQLFVCRLLCVISARYGLPKSVEFHTDFLCGFPTRSPVCLHHLKVHRHREFESPRLWNCVERDIEGRWDGHSLRLGCWGSAKRYARGNAESRSPLFSTTISCFSGFTI